MWKYLVLAHALFSTHTVLAANRLVLANADIPGTKHITTEQYVQNLLSSSLTGDALLFTYDSHYDSLPYDDKMAEKKLYPSHIYKDLLEHRKHRKKTPP